MKTDRNLTPQHWHSELNVCVSQVRNLRPLHISLIWSASQWMPVQNSTTQDLSVALGVWRHYIVPHAFSYWERLRSDHYPICDLKEGGEFVLPQRQLKPSKVNDFSGAATSVISSIQR